MLEKLHLRRHTEKIEVEEPGAKIKIKEQPNDPVTPPGGEPAGSTKVKVHVKDAPGVREQKVKRLPVPFHLNPICPFALVKGLSPKCGLGWCYIMVKFA